MGEIYMIENIITGYKYIGQSKYSGIVRYKAHVKEATHNKTNLRLYNAFRKYGTQNMKLTIFETGVPEEKLDELEIYYIAKYDTYNNGYNNTTGGGGVRGYYHSNQTKRKISIASKRNMYRINTPERTAKIIAAQKGRPFTEEHRQHIKNSIGNREKENNPFYGKKHTLESKLKMSDSSIKYGVFQMKDEKVLGVFKSVKEAAIWCIDNNYTNATLSSVMYRIYYTCKGNQKLCYGFNWKYVKKCID